MPNIRSITLAIALVPALSGVAAAENALTAQEQDFGQSVTVQSVSVDQDGWLVIHAVQDGKPVVPASIGHTYVKAGTTENVAVALTEEAEDGPLIAMLHVDDGELGVYEFGPDSTDHDKPVVGESGPLVVKFEAND